MEENAPQQAPVENSAQKLRSLNKTPLLIAGLVILTGVLLALSLGSRKANLPNLATEEPAKTDYAHTTLSLSEPRESGNASEMDVNIDTQDNIVTGVQLELSYDPKVLTRVDIAPGEFMEDPVVIQKRVDATNGRISYVLGAPLGKAGIKGQGPVAVITFTKTSDAETSLTFLPETLVTAEGHSQSVLKETVSAVITSPNP
jgi:hypothetical protein